MLATNENFDAKHVLANKTPLYLLKFDGESTDYCNHKPASPVNTLKRYLISPSGAAQKVTPEEGKATIGGVKAVLLDTDDEITALLATDSVYFHRKKTVIKIGYMGMAEADLLTRITGWVTGIGLTADGLGYEFDIEDPQQWMKRKIFRNAHESAITLLGHPLNLLLQVLTSTGAGTNGAYDVLAEENGLGLSTDYINVAGIEAVRDDWFPLNSIVFSFSIDERIEAKSWIETEILKVLNCYPVIDADGRYNIKPYKPALAATTTVQEFNEDNIVGMPHWDMGLDKVVNEVEIHYDWDGDDYVTIDYYEDPSIATRGPGKKAIVIKSKGMQTALGGADISATRAARIFNRFATPPPGIKITTWFSQWLSEAGDIVPVTHSKIPDVEGGSRGISSERMEVVNISPDFKGGKVSVELLATEFAKSVYNTISPSVTVVSGLSSTQFTVSAADAAQLTEGWEMIVYRPNMVAFSGHVTITDITGTTVTVDDMGGTPAAGYVAQFADYDDCTAAQKKWGWICDDSNYLGTANDPATLIAP